MLGCGVHLEKLTVPQLVKKLFAFHYRVYKRPSPIPILSQMNPVHTLPPYYLKQLKSSSVV
jgi:hypothetical protein